MYTEARRMHNLDIDDLVRDLKLAEGWQAKKTASPNWNW